MKKIGLLVLNNFVNDNRVHKIASSLSQLGHTITVIAFLKGNVAEREQKEHYDVHRIKLRTAKLPGGNKLFGALKYLEFIYKVARNYRKHDILHCNDFEAMFVGTIAKLSNPKLKLVYDCHEFERERAEMNWVKKWSTRIFEPLIIPFAQHVFVVSTGIKKEYHRMYPKAKVTLLRNAPHARDFTNTDILRQTFELRKDQTIYLYQGGLYPSRGVEQLLTVFSHFQDDKKVIVFMGFGPLTARVKSACETYPQIRFLDAVPYDKIVEYTSGADVGFITTQNVSLNNYYCLPNKMFEYMHAEIPIITNNLYDCRLLVEGEKIGTVIETFDEQGILDAIIKAEALDLNEIKKRMATIKHSYSWQQEEKELFSAYSQLYA